jgi:hypothetical protein
MIFISKTTHALEANPKATGRYSYRVLLFQREKNSEWYFNFGDFIT